MFQNVKHKATILFIAFGLLANLGLALHQYMLFMKAYMADEKAVILYINVFGEADMEFYMLTFSAIIGFLATMYVLWMVRKYAPVIELHKAFRTGKSSFELEQEIWRQYNEENKKQ